MKTAVLAQKTEKTLNPNFYYKCEFTLDNKVLTEKEMNENSEKRNLNHGGRALAQRLYYAGSR